jgi:arylsulfatase
MKRYKVLIAMMIFFIANSTFAQKKPNILVIWYLDHVFLLLPATAYVGNFISTFKEFPPRMKAASFNLGDTMDALKTPISN